MTRPSVGCPPTRCKSGRRSSDRFLPMPPKDDEADAESTKLSPGIRLESEVYDYLKRVLLPELLGLDPAATGIHRHKAYHSAARGGPIVVDISLELFLKGHASPFLLWIWE